MAGGHDCTVYVLSAPKSAIIGLRKEYSDLYSLYDKDTHKVLLKMAKDHGWVYERK